MAQLLSNLPIGSKITFGKHQINTETALPIVWVVADKNHSGYPANSVTLITEKIIDLRAFDGKESSWEEGLDTKYGYCNYRVSNIRQWLNSSGTAGNWYTDQHDNDNPPTQVLHNTAYNNRPGFLYHFTTDERNALLNTTINAKYNDVVSTITDKVFLPSSSEILGVSSSDGSSRFAYFSSTNDVCAYPTEQVITNTLASASYKPTSASEYWEYWTRGGNSYNAGTISATGASDSSQAYIGSIGVRPCINLSATTKISSTATDGHYTIEANIVPTISGSNSNLGEKTEEFSQTYSVSDADGDSITVTEYIDDLKIRSYVATLGATNTFSVTGTTWLKLANGVHTLKVVATDGFSEVTRTFTFTKKVTKFEVQRKTAIPHRDKDGKVLSTPPKAIIATVVKVIPAEATFEVKACNNGFDTSPTWEDITNSVTSGGVYNFTNTTKTATEWGVNIKVIVDRNGASGACYITEIGGNFE